MRLYIPTLENEDNRLCFPNSVRTASRLHLCCRLHWKVVGILDGDTIEVLHNTHPERIRLSGIDCPEKGQAFDNRAKQAASALVFGKDVILQTHGQDKYGRTIGDVILPDGINVFHTLGKGGWCWWY